MSDLTTAKKNKTIITRKVQVYIKIPKENKTELNDAYSKLRKWQKIAFKAANICASTLYSQEMIKELSYFTQEITHKLVNNSLDSNGILNTSRANSIYRTIAKKFNAEIPTAILSSLSQHVYKSFSAEKNDYFNGKRSLRIYKNTIPVPIPKQAIYNLRWNEQINEFEFSLFKSEKYHIPCQTRLGADRSNNKIMLTRILSDEYKLCESSYTINEKGQIFMLFAIELPSQQIKLDYKKEVIAKLSFLAPVLLIHNNKEFLIGNKENYVHKRLAIQSGRRRKMAAMKDNKGGKGRAKKMQAINALNKKERNFMHSYTHKISSEIVDFCISMNAGVIRLPSINELTAEAKEHEFVLRNWSISGLIEKLKYKCQLNKIKIIVN